MSQIHWLLNLSPAPPGSAYTLEHNPHWSCHKLIKSWLVVNCTEFGCLFIPGWDSYIRDFYCPKKERLNSFKSLSSILLCHFICNLYRLCVSICSSAWLLLCNSALRLTWGTSGTASRETSALAALWRTGGNSCHSYTPCHDAYRVSRIESLVLNLYSY